MSRIAHILVTLFIELPVALRREIPALYPAVSGAPLSSSGLEKTL